MKEILQDKEAMPYRLFFLLLVSITGVDQLSKALIASISPFYPVEIIQGWLYLIKTYNTGAAWSLLEGRSFTLGFLGAGILYGIWHFRKPLELERPYQQVALGVFAGGVLGNMIDRLWSGSVLDFIQVYLGSYPWPTFNVADMAIVTGVGLYGLRAWGYNRGGG